MGSNKNCRKKEESPIRVEYTDFYWIDLDRRQVRTRFFSVQVQGSQGSTDTFKVTECANTVILWSRKCGGFLIVGRVRSRSDISAPVKVSRGSMLYNRLNSARPRTDAFSLILHCCASRREIENSFIPLTRVEITQWK